MSVKQVIVVRKDIDMPKGKLAAQVSHASMGAMLQLMRSDDGNAYHFDVKENCGASKWLNGSFTKIVLYCDSLEEMLEIHDKAKENNLNACLIEDEGRTVFNEPTYTCLGLGPDFNEKFDGITSHLKMVR